jgi:hypothetical protein
VWPLFIIIEGHYITQNNLIVGLLAMTRIVRALGIFGCDVIASEQREHGNPWARAIGACGWIATPLCFTNVTLASSQ